MGPSYLDEVNVHAEKTGRVEFWGRSIHSYKFI